MQLDLFKSGTPIETVVITPTKEMPLDVYKLCYQLAYFMERMERLPNGMIVWDEGVTDIVDGDAAEMHYGLLQNEWFETSMELPVIFIDKLLEIES